MQLSIILLAASFASSALASSYKYARGIDIAPRNAFPELTERALDDDSELIRHFLRSLDEDELNELYRRNIAMKAKQAKINAQIKAHKAKIAVKDKVANRAHNAKVAVKENINKLKNKAKDAKFRMKGIKDGQGNRLTHRTGSNRFSLSSSGSSRS